MEFIFFPVVNEGCRVLDEGAPRRAALGRVGREGTAPKLACMLMRRSSSCLLPLLASPAPTPTYPLPGQASRARRPSWMWPLRTHAPRLFLALPPTPRRLHLLARPQASWTRRPTWMWPW